jgi:hypothetical protein
MQSFMKIRAVGVESFHTNRRTDIIKLIVAFGNFAKAPKKQYSLGYWGKSNSKTFYIFYASNSCNGRSDHMPIFHSDNRVQFWCSQCEIFDGKGELT